MVEKNELSELYVPELFQEGSNTIEINEKDEGATMTKVRLELIGARFIYSDGCLWKKSVELFVKKNEQQSFKKGCDGFVICNNGVRNYLIWIELKSSFDDVFSKAIDQIYACYVKSKLLLNGISTYNKNDYEEFGIIISHPQKPINNSDVDIRRRRLAEPYSRPWEKCRRRYHTTGSIEIKGEDFDENRMHISPNIKCNSLKIYNHTDDNDSTIVDLNTVIQQMFGHPA